MKRSKGLFHSIFLGTDSMAYKPVRGQIILSEFLSSFTQLRSEITPDLNNSVMIIIRAEVIIRTTACYHNVIVVS